MDEVYAMYAEGKIEKSLYYDLAMNSTFSALDHSGYRFVRSLGKGTFATVTEVKRPCDKTSFAAKIVLVEDTTDSEKYIWYELKHPNILRFRAGITYESSRTMLFRTDVHLHALTNLVNSFQFQMDSKAFERSVSWICGVIEGLKYIHDRDLCLLNMEIENILISESDTAVICDLRSVTSNINCTTKYGDSKWIYRPPEARPRIDIRKPVDGQKFDVWSLGIVALDLFTGFSYLEESMYWGGSLSFHYWTECVYPAIYGIVQKNEFKKLMRYTFPSSYPSKEDVDDVISLVVTCLDMNPGMRPSTKQLLQQRIFGGRNFCTLENTDVWHEKASFYDLHVLMSMGEMMEKNRCPKMCDSEILLFELASENVKKICDLTLTEDSVALKTECDVIDPVSDEFPERGCEGKAEEVSEVFNDTVVVPKKPLKGRKKFMQWARKKKATVTKMFNRFWSPRK